MSSRIRQIVWFLYFAGTAGFAIGTAGLFGLIRPGVDLLRLRGTSPWMENLLVGVIIALCLVSATVAGRFFGKRFLGPLSRVPLLAGSIVVTAATFWFWWHPAGVPEHGELEALHLKSGERIAFGPYPEVEQLLQLKQEGFGAIVSLLHPAIMPMEPILITREEERLKNMGFRYHHLPVLPWIGQNEEALEKLDGILRSEPGRVYVHCYLGADRILMARRFLEGKGWNRQLGIIAKTERQHSLSAVTQLERGPVYRLSEETYLIPYPTDEEWVGYVLPSNIKTVVSLMDPKNRQDHPWIEKERETLEKYGVTLEVLPMVSPDPGRVAEVLRQVETFPKPMAIHAFLSPSEATEAIRKAYPQ